MKYNIVDGNLITKALEGDFDIITHGCNCFCVQKAGIAKQMSETFRTSLFNLESDCYKGDINKLGSIDYEKLSILKTNKQVVPYSDLWSGKTITVVNSYTQFEPGPNLDMEALRLCLRKINHQFKGLHIGIPKIGCGIASGIWDVLDPKLEELTGYEIFVEDVVKEELKDMDITVVNYV